eukprot:794691-Pyramimonas_sp.AAC.1
MRAWRSLDAILSRFQALQDDTVGASDEAAVHPSSTCSGGACDRREAHTGERPAAPSVEGLSTEGPSLSLGSMGFVLPDYTSPYSGPTPLAAAAACKSGRPMPGCEGCSAGAEVQSSTDLAPADPLG